MPGAESKRPANIGRAMRASTMLLALMTAVAFPALALSGQKVSNRKAAEHKLKYRSLLIFAPDTSNKDLSNQKAVVAAQRNGLKEREIVVVYVVGKSVSAELGPEPDATPVKLRSHYRVAKNDFRVVLIEKDGNTQMLSDAPVTADQLFQTIDAVPTHKDNAKQRG